MGEIVFGTDEHIAGLSRQALESDFRWVYSRMRELEDECVRLQAELEAARVERTGRIKEHETGHLVCSECGAVQTEWTVYYCWNCGSKVVKK